MKVVPSQQSLRYLRHLIRPSSSSTTTSFTSPIVQPLFHAYRTRRHFHRSAPLLRTETHTLSDIGEGVKEVQIIQWFVEEGAQVEEWDPLCEVQSDKAAVEITSKYSGVIKKLHFKRDAIVQVGDGMLDIEVEGGEEEGGEGEGEDVEGKSEPETKEEAKEEPSNSADKKQDTLPPDPAPEPEQEPQSKGKHASLATPAVRGMLKEHSLKIESIQGTGKDGRVLKEDVLNHINKKPSGSPSTSSSQSTPSAPSHSSAGPQTETTQPLTPVQNAMFKAMTASLSIPHFLYTDSINITALTALRARINATSDTKISYLPFIIKAISLALKQFPTLNARLDTTSGPKPQLQLRSQHNIGVAMDTPNGLLVPVIHSAQALPIRQLASHIASLSERGRAGKLATADLTGGSITVSNIGNIGGEVVAPVLVEGQLVICGVGKIKDVPIFEGEGDMERVVKAKMMQLSWSADHRVVDGATMARAADLVKRYLEEPGRMVVDLV